MTKTLQTLVKISKQELNEKRHNLNVFLKKMDELYNDKQALADSLISELKYVEQSMDARYAYNNFSASVKMKQTNIDAALELLDKQVEVIEEEIRIAFAELKKYEILLENKQAKIKKAIDRKVQIELDEVAITQHNSGDG